MVYIENAITIEDISRALKAPQSKVESEAGELDVFIGSDWAGRPAVSEVDAQGLVSGSLRRTQDHDRA